MKQIGVINKTALILGLLTSLLQAEASSPFRRAHHVLSPAGERGYVALKGEGDHAQDCNDYRGEGAFVLQPYFFEADKLARYYFPELRLGYDQLTQTQKKSLWNRFSRQTGLPLDKENPCDFPFGLTPQLLRVSESLPAKKVLHLNCLACHLGEVPVFDPEKIGPGGSGVSLQAWLGAPNKNFYLQGLASVILATEGPRGKAGTLAAASWMLSKVKSQNTQVGHTFATWGAFTLSELRNSDRRWDIALVASIKALAEEVWENPTRLPFLHRFSRDNTIPWSEHRHSAYHFSNNIFVKDPRWNYLINSSFYLAPGNSPDELLGSPEKNPKIARFKEKMDAIVDLIDETEPPPAVDYEIIRHLSRVRPYLLDEFVAKVRAGEQKFNMTCARCHNHTEILRNVGTSPALSEVNFATVRSIFEGPFLRDAQEKFGAQAAINPDFFSRADATSLEKKNPFSGKYRPPSLVRSWQKKMYFHDASVSWEQIWNPRNPKDWQALGQHRFPALLSPREKVEVQTYLKVRCFEPRTNKAEFYKKASYRACL